MDSLKEKLKAYWGHIVVFLAALAALVAALTSTKVDDNLGNTYWPAFKQAYDQGEAMQGTTSPTTVSPSAQ